MLPSIIEELTPRYSTLHASLLEPSALIKFILSIYAKVILWILLPLKWLLRFLESSLSYNFRRRQLAQQMREADSYEEFARAAHTLDLLEGREQWKQKRQSDAYDYKLIERRLMLLRHYSSSDRLEDRQMLLLSLRGGLLRNLGGLGSPSLYSHCHIGTKHLIEEYIDEVVRQLRTICDEDNDLNLWGNDLQKKFDFFFETRQSFGRSALLLSGGASLGLYHFGVIKALWEQRLLPRVISGSSVGSLVASLVCCLKDDEIPMMWRSGSLKLEPFEASQKGSFRRKLVRLIKRGVLMDIRKLEDVVRSNLGDITFKEAYDRTGRILNISVASTTRYEVPRLLNYLTSPNVLIWSAACASCALKGLYEPVELMAKDASGKIREYHPSGVKWSDGSVEYDLPMARLAELFNVNHFIVSQVNPHVVPFLRGDRGQVRQRGWRFYLTYLVSSEVAHRVHQIAELGVAPGMMKWLQPLFTQKYSGDVTIVPDVTLSDYIHIVSNPTDSFIQQCTKKGERATWPKISLIRNRCAIEIALEYCVQRMREKMRQPPTYQPPSPSFSLRVN